MQKKYLFPVVFQVYMIHTIENILQKLGMDLDPDKIEREEEPNFGS